MEPTTVTTICMIVFAMGMITWTVYLWFCDWQPAVTRYLTEDELEAEIQAAVRQMRRAIEDYERGDRHL